MSYTRALLSLVLLVCLFPASALAQGEEWRRRLPNLEHEFGYAPVDDGVELSFTLYRPSATGRFPTLLIYNMYDASSVTPHWNQTWNPDVGDYLELGYAVMGANVRGTACSSGPPDMLNAEVLGKDGARLVEWIVEQPWSDGSVGMFGHSGSGLTQFYVAAQNPKGLKAVIPGAAPADFYRDLGYPGGLFNYAFMYHWSEGAQTEQNLRAAQKHIEAGDEACRERIQRSRPNHTYRDMVEHPFDDEWYEVNSVDSVASRIRVPTLIIFGWQDQNVASRAAYVFNDLKGPRKMLLAEASHSLYIRSLEVRREKIRFFDYWLRGRQNGVMDEKPVQVWLTMKGKIEVIPDRIGYYDQLPVAGTQWTRYYLREGGQLDLESPTETSQAQFLYPAASHLVYAENVARRYPEKLRVLTFSTPPFERERTIVGPIEARVFLSSTQTDTSVSLVLHEVDPLGNRKYLQRGFLRASMRRIDPEASSPGLPVHLFRQREPLQPGEVVELVIDMNSTGSVIEAGNSLELTIMAPTPVPEPIGQWCFLPLDIAVNTVHMSPDFASYILLPIVE